MNASYQYAGVHSLRGNGLKTSCGMLFCIVAILVITITCCGALSTGNCAWFPGCMECSGINPRKDYLCLDPACCGMDPDCWCTDTEAGGISYNWDDCSCMDEKVLIGTFTRNGYTGEWGVCTPPSGRPCMSDEDCNSSLLACDVKHGVCFFKSFVWITPKRLAVKIGRQGMLFVKVKEPMNRPATFSLAIDPTHESQYFAKFYGKSNEVTISLAAGEIKEIPLYFTAASSGDFPINIIATDTSNERIRSETSSDGGGTGETHVSVSAKKIESDNLTTFISGPGPCAWQILLTAIIASIPFTALRRQQQQERDDK